MNDTATILSRPRQSVRRTLDALTRREGDAIALIEGIADAVDEGLIVVDANRNLLVFNRRAEEITGFSRDEVLGRHCLTGIRCSTCLEACAVFERGEVPPVALDLFRSGGERRRIVKAAHTLRDSQDRVIGAVEVFHEAAPSEASDVVAPWTGAVTLMEALGRALLILDEHMRIRRASRAFAELVGRSEDALEGVAVVDLLGDALFGPEANFAKALRAGERREGWRALVRGPDGSAHAVSVTAAPLPKGKGCGELPASQGRYLVVLRPETAESPEVRASIRFEGMVARSPAMRRVFSLIEHLRDSDASVLITGESGTGKELVARAVHALSMRSAEPFVAVNCGALPGDLLESELFGHARGAFTGAVRDKPGRFEVVGRGTLFLDEVGDLPLHLQVKLLRVLQEHTFERVGENHSRRFEGRIVAATHVDLPSMVAAGRFREDLFYRLNVVPITLPPLRDRPEDIELLVDELMRRIGQRRSRSLRLSPAAMRALLSAQWPGNVRQLENALEYAHAVCDGQTIHLEDLPPEVVADRTGLEHSPADPPTAAAVTPRMRGTPPLHPGPKPALPPDGVAGLAESLGPGERWPTRVAVVRALDAAGGRRAQAARLLGVSRTTLWRRMRDYGLA